MALGSSAVAEMPPDHAIPPTFEHRALTRPNGATMNVYHRNNSGPVLVLVPGTWGDAQRFAPLIAALPEDLPVVLIELCWQGGNVPPSLDMTIESLADDVLGVVHELALERFYIGGHSIGGMIAVEIAGRKVPGLAGAIPMEGWTHHTVVQTAFGGTVTGELAAEEQAQSEASRARGRAHLAPVHLEAIGEIWKHWNGYGALERAEVPILHVWGDRGKPHATREALQIPDRTTIEIAWMPDASHPLVMETPTELAAAILSFMKRHGG